MTNAHHEPTQRHDPLFRVHTDAFVDWLATTTNSRGDLFADTYAIADHNTFRRGGEGMHDRIQMLVDQAHSDAILTTDGDYSILLWQVADEGFLLTLDGPTPPRLCSFHVAVDDLVPDKTSGTVAALAVLMSMAQIANQLLTEHARMVAAITTAPTAFPNIGQGRPVNPTPTTTSASPTVRRPHGR